MPAAYTIWYDDAVSGSGGKWEAQKRCDAVKAALAAAGIAATVEDDPPWLDAGNLSGYYQGSGGEMFVLVDDADKERGKAIADEWERANPRPGRG